MQATEVHAKRVPQPPPPNPTMLDKIEEALRRQGMVDTKIGRAVKQARSRKPGRQYAKDDWR